MSAVVEYVPRDSLLHRLNPITKICWASLILGLAIMYNHYLFMAFVLAATIALAVLGNVFKEISKLFKGLIIFALILFAMQVCFYDLGKPLFYLIPIGKGFIGISREDMLMSFAMALRMLAILISFLVFLATTKTQDLVNVMVERFKVPYDYAFMFLTSMRFIPTFLGEIKQISDAQKARGFVLEGWNPLKKIKAYIPIAVPLVLLSLKKAQQMALSMETRGYGSGDRTYLREIQMSRVDYSFISAGILIIITAGLFKLKGF